MPLKKDLKVPAIYVPMEERPRCIIEGCGQPRKPTSYFSSGYPRFDKHCNRHSAIKYGTGGWNYKIHRKSYCENIDGRLGFICTTTIMNHEWQCDVDHIDENPTNNEPSNLQTLCKCCHAYKTLTFFKKYGLTPGRKYHKRMAGQMALAL